jgi:hypothetical protein
MAFGVAPVRPSDCETSERIVIEPCISGSAVVGALVPKLSKVGLGTSNRRFREVGST